MAFVLWFFGVDEGEIASQSATERHSHSSLRLGRV